MKDGELKLIRCPYRLTTTTKAAGFTDNMEYKIEEFPDCHGSTCPFYEPHQKICLRVKNELGGIKNGKTK